MEFVCVGFDVRRWPYDEPLNADWEQHEKRCAELRERFGCWQNQYQLLEIDSAQMPEITALVASWPDCNLLLLEYPKEMVLLRNQNLGIKTTIVEQDLTGFICRGLDVCDFFGLFSVLGHPELAARRGHEHPFKPDELMSALEVVQYASILSPEHAPYAVARLWSLK